MRRLLCLLAAAAFSLQAQVKRTGEEIVLDGKLNEKAWKTAEISFG